MAGAQLMKRIPRIKFPQRHPSSADSANCSLHSIELQNMAFVVALQSASRLPDMHVLSNVEPTRHQLLVLKLCGNNYSIKLLSSANMV